MQKILKNNIIEFDNIINKKFNLDNISFKILAKN